MMEPKWIPTKKDYQELGAMFILSVFLTVAFMSMGICGSLSNLPEANIANIIMFLFSIAFTSLTTQGYCIIFHKLKSEERQLCWTFLPKLKRR